jgi:predicted MFS family arabinose efflux permease
MKKRFDLSYAITLAAIFATGFLSSALLILKPLIVGGLIDDYHFSPAQAGYVTGIEMAGIGLAPFIVAAIGGAWNRRHVVLVGTTIGILGTLGPVLSDAFVPILLCRFIAGFGCGLVAAIALAVIATTRDPDRTFGLYYMMAYAFAVPLMAGGAWSMTHFHVRGAYMFLALTLLVVYVTAQRIPESFTGLKGDGKAQALPPFPLVGGALSLGLSLLFWIGLGGVWAFLERLGLQAGVDREAVGGVLTFYAVAAFVGALTASLLHTRLGRLPMLTAAIVGAVLSVGLIGWVPGLVPFAAGVIIFSYIWPLFLTYLSGTMAVIDPTGRVVAMSVASQCIGMALGPAIGGELAGRYGYVSIAVMALICFAMALALLPPLVLRMRAAESLAGSPVLP